MALAGAGTYVYMDRSGGFAAPASEGAPAEPANPTDSAPMRAEVIAENLAVPWEVLFLPDGELLVTERPGTVVLLRKGVEIPVSGVRQVGEGGLL